MVLYSWIHLLLDNSFHIQITAGNYIFYCWCTACGNSYMVPSSCSRYLWSNCHMMQNSHSCCVKVICKQNIQSSSDTQFEYPTRDQVILKCNINDAAFVISQVGNLVIIRLSTNIASKVFQRAFSQFNSSCCLKVKLWHILPRL